MMPRAMLVGTAALLACAAAGGIRAIQPAAHAQEPPQVFRTEANLVYVDVYPRSQDRLVEGLTAADFQVFEDGKPQTIQTFELISVRSSPVDAERRDPATVADSERQATDPRNRLFVVYLDRFHTTRAGSRDSRQPLVDFLNRTIGASDLFAVMTPETPVAGLTFVRRTDTIEGELSAHWDWGERDQLLVPRTPAEERLIRCALEAYRGDADKVDAIHRRFRENLTYSNLDVLIRRLRDIRDERTNFLLVSEGWTPEGERPALADFPDTGRPPIPTIGVGRGGQLMRGNPQTGNPDAAGCRADISHLASIDFVDRFRQLVTAAEQANVTIYPIDVGGLHGGLRTTETLRTLANATDGYAAVNSNDLAAGFRRIADRLTSYYLLGYYSTNTVADGRFRKIEVKVARPGVSVAARRGYLAPSPAAVAAARAAATAAPVVRDDVAGAFGQLARLESDAEIFAAAALRGRTIGVVADLAARDVDRGRWTSGATVDVTVTGGAAAPVTAHGTIEAGRRSVQIHVPLEGEPRGPWRIRIRVSDAQGSADTEIDLAAAGGAPLLLRASGPARAAMQPVAEASFRRTERLRVEWPVPREAGVVTARILDRRGQPLGQPLPATDAAGPAGERVVNVDLTLGSFAPGDYLIELATGAGEPAARQLVAFRVTR